MAGLDAVALPPVDGHHLALGGVGHGAAVDGHHTRIHGHGRGAWHVVHHLAWWLGQQPVTGADFFLGAGDVNRGGHHGAGDLARAVRHVRGGFPPCQQGLAHVLAFKAQDFAGDRVFQRGAVAEHAEVARLAGLHGQGRRACATGVGTVALAEQHTVFAGGDDPGGIGQNGLFHHQRLGQEGFDQVGRQRGQGRTRQAFVACAGRQAYGFLVRIARAGAQAGVAVLLLQVQLLTGENQVGVADLLQVHAPQLGPAPGAQQVNTGNGPQRVAAFNGIDIGRIRGQFTNGHTLLCHLLRRGALGGADGEVLRRGRRGHQAGRQNRQGRGCCQSCAEICHVLFPVQLHCKAPPCARRNTL